MSKKITIFIIVAVFILVAALMLLKNNATTQSFVASNSSFSSLVATPTPMPYEEVTIPYLRKKTFDSKLGERQLISNNGTYTSYLTSYTSDGLKINGLLTIPSGEGKHPAIVFVHGYIPPAQYTTTGQYADYVDYLARNGFVVFKIDLRGHGNSEGQAGGGYFGADYIADTLNAYSALQKADFVDAQNIGVWGHSMAGNVLLRSAVVKKDIPAVVIWAGAVYSYTDREKYGINDTSFQPNANPTSVNRRQRLTDLYGQASSGSAFWRLMAPTNFLQDFTGAIEVHHAIDDTVVNVGYSRDLMKHFDKTKVAHELHEYATGGHNISGASFNTAMQRTVEFFEKHLK